MKVRSKLSGTEYEAVDGLVIRDAGGVLHVVDRTEFEEVQEDRIEDVTKVPS